MMKKKDLTSKMQILTSCKARPALDLMDKFTQAYIPGCELAVNEAMIGFKGRFFLEQYLPGKPTKWGIQAWGVADSVNGCLLKCDIYKVGKKKEIRQQDLLLGEQVVLQLTEKFWGKWHHIYFDNFFSSTYLMKMLLEQETYSCGNNVIICVSLYLVNTTIYFLMCVTTLHVSTLCVGHHQVCLDL